MTNETKLLAIIGTTPIISDFIEDLCEDGTIQREMKKTCLEIKRAIDRLTRLTSQGIEKEAAFQQNDIELWFRQELKQNFEG